VPALLLGSAGLLALLLIATGGPGSPLAPGLVLWALAAERLLPLRRAAAATAAIAAAVLLGGAVFGAVDLPGLALLAAALAAAIAAARFAGAGSRPATGRGTSAESNVAFPTEPPPLEREVARLLAGFRDRAGAERVVLWSLDAGAGRLVPADADGPRPPAWLETRADPLGWALREGVAMHVEPAPGWALPGTRLWARPVGEAGEERRLLSVELPAGADVAEIEAAADDVASRLTLVGRIAAERSRADLEQQATRALEHALQSLPRHRTPADFAAALAAEAVEIAAGTGAAVAVWDREADEGVVLAVAGEDGGPITGSRFGGDASDAAIAARNLAAIRRDDGPVAAALVAPGERWTRRPRAAALILLLAPGDGVVGVLAVWSGARAPLSEPGVEKLTVLAPYAALQLQAAAEFERMQHDAGRDPLTGLLNRRAFDRDLERESLRFDRHARPLALLALDIDHFKSVNDRYGHETGDQVLTAVARTIQAGIRDVDRAARFGGEEFIVLLPETSMAEAMEVGERLRAAVERVEPRLLGVEERVRVSVGVACAPESVRNPADLLREADERLYEAKREGRNRVVGRKIR
jgi:diguanylate cyclase (GGDEF)-like protein